MLNLFWKLFGRGKAAHPQLITEVEMLQESLKEQERTNPDFDRGARIATCAAGVEDNMDHGLLRSIYGEEILSTTLKQQG